MSDYAELERRCAEIFENHERMLDNKRRSDRRERKAPHIKQEMDAATDNTLRKNLAKRRIIRREFKYRLPRKSDSYIEGLNQTIGFLLNIWRFGADPLFVCIERGLLHLLYANHDFKRVHQAILDLKLGEICENHRYLITEIEDIWDSASYQLHGPTNKDPGELTPVNKYRIRDRVKCPTKQFVGVRKYKIDAASKRILECTYSTNQRPDRDAKNEIVRQTGLSYDTVSNWFKNRRQREKKRSEPEVIYQRYDHTQLPPAELRMDSAGSQETLEGSSSVDSTQRVDFYQQPMTMMSDHITAHLCLDPACVDPVCIDLAWSNNDQYFNGGCCIDLNIDGYRFVEPSGVQCGVCPL